MYSSLFQRKGNIRSKGFWKFNGPITKFQNYINEIKNLIHNFSTKTYCDFSRQLTWEFSKYEICKFTIHHWKGLAKKRQQKATNLEN